MMENVNGSKGKHQVPKWIFLVLAWLLVACILTQTFFAGSAVFNDQDWSQHISFIHFFEFLPILLIIFALVARLPKGFVWLSVIIQVLIFAQYATAHITDAGAIHPVIATIMFFLAISMAMRSKKWLTK